MQIRDRIKSLVRVRAGDLRPSPKNWRVHTTEQETVLRSLLANLGFVDAVLVRETDTGLQLIDGHLRASIDPDAKIPALVVDVTPEEADLLLATLDPTAAMAQTDAAKFAELVAALEEQPDAVEAMFRSIEETAGTFDVAEATLPDLPAGERDTMHTMNFTLTAEQEESVKAALAKAKTMGDFGDTGNQNSNGNALARVAEVFLGHC